MSDSPEEDTSTTPSKHQQDSVHPNGSNEHENTLPSKESKASAEEITSNSEQNTSDQNPVASEKNEELQQSENSTRKGDNSEAESVAEPPKQEDTEKSQLNSSSNATDEHANKENPPSEETVNETAEDSAKPESEDRTLPESEIAKPESLSHAQPIEEVRPEDLKNVPTPASTAGFTQDPLEIDDMEPHSQIPTPESADNNSTHAALEDVEEDEKDESINPLAPKGATKYPRKKQPAPPEPEKLAEIPKVEVANVVAETKAEPTEPVTSEPTTTVGGAFKRVPSGIRKSVSIAPADPKTDTLTPTGAIAMDPRARSTTNDSAITLDDRPPNLVMSCSLPTVVGYDHDGSVADYDGSVVGTSIHPRSEIGRDELRKKKRRKRRQRYNTERATATRETFKRPFIASPFMPIATQISVDPDRRSLPVPGYRARHGSGMYGSMRERTDEVVQKKAPPTPPPEASSEEDEDEEEGEESSTEDQSSVTSERKWLPNIQSSIGNIRRRCLLSLSNYRRLVMSSFSSLTSKQLLTVAMLVIANLCSTVAFSCIAPFYPAEAQLKGMTESQTGIVFGIFEFVMFVSAPLFGRYMINIGSKNMFVFGIGMTGVTAIMFGFLNFLPSGQMFFWASLVIRMLEAVGDAAFVTSSFAISAKCFPGNIAVIIGLLETFAGLGYTAGPLIGGFLYEFGGFQVPFLVLGGVLLIATAFSCFLVEKADESEEVGEDMKGMMKMLQIPEIWVMLYAVIIASLSVSFLDPTLSAHLASFNLTPTLVGLMFLLEGGIYTLTAPLWGLLIDRFKCSVLVLFVGAIIGAVSMLLIGPSPFVPFEKNLVVIGICMTGLGLSIGALYIPTFQNCLDTVKERGWGDSFHTYGCVSGIFQSAFAFGGFFGPTIGGMAVESIGFEWTTAIIGVINIFLVIVLMIFYGSVCCRQCLGIRQEQESEPLLA